MPDAGLALQLSERPLEVVEKAPTAPVAALVDEPEGLAGGVEVLLGRFSKEPCGVETVFEGGKVVSCARGKAAE